MINDYINSHEVKKLQLGSGINHFEGWLNTEADTVNVTIRFPIDDNVFDYVYNEHMIEHITWEQGLFMLKESYRVLKPGGKIRVTTPGIEFLIDLYINRNETNNNYIEWGTIVNGLPFADPTIVINNFVRGWGHQFIYSKELLVKTLEMAGFQNMREYNISESDDINFQNLENAGRMPPGYLQMESMTIEATKVVDSGSE
jgi:predicted SAM-dependent methyltransferase